ncbi:MAG: hypothetical protein IJ190_10455 [Prevotella sp.]|nr:hypothetical protein [Prevotella sp.]
MKKRLIQIEAGEALLDSGVSFPLRSLKIPFKKRPLVIRLTAKRPRLSVQIRIARIYLRMGVKAKDILAFSKEEDMRFLAEHGKDISLMAAMSVCCTSLRCRLFSRPLAWIIRHYVADEHIQFIFSKFILLIGTKRFTSFIRSVETANPVAPRLSHKGKRS